MTLPKLMVAGLVALALVLASCSSTPGDSGIEGMVTIGPISPVQRQGEPGERPYAGRILVKRMDGRAVAEVMSGADGRFKVDLKPGSYRLEPQSPGPLPIARPQEVTVEPHKFTEVSVSYDSGIR